MLVMAWNPCIRSMALPPCHYGFSNYSLNGKLNLLGATPQ